MRRNALMIASLSLMLAPVTLSSQTTPDLVPGARVRLSARSLGTESRIGIVTKMENGKLFLVESGATRAAFEIPLDRLDGLDLNVSKADNHRHKGALIGMLTGIVAGGVLGYFATNCPNGCDFDSMGVVAAGPVGGLGAYLGYEIGQNMKSDGWVPVTLPLKVGFAPTLDRKFRLSGSFVF